MRQYACKCIGRTYRVEVLDSGIYSHIEVISHILSTELQGIPSVFGNAFSNRRAKSGSFRRAFMSVITFYMVRVGT